jgi:tRNA(Ile)-lysidine synthase
MVNSNMSKREDISNIAAHALSRLGVTSTASILAAVSGGVDSMTLTYLLNDLRKKGHLKKLVLVHINHSLRGKESDKDELLVKQFAKKLKIPVYSFRVDTRAHAIEKRIGIEEAARNLRYEKIAEVAEKKKCQFIATAHTANDQAETVLMNIVRGSGLNGLQGIPEARKLAGGLKLIRPILSINKKWLLDFAAEHRIPYREDLSNDSLDFQRNRIRHLVLPKLEKAFKGRDVYSGFAKMTQNIAGIAEYIESEVESLRRKTPTDQASFFIQRKIISLKREALLQAPAFLRRELILQESSSLSDKFISIDRIQTALLESFLSYPSRKPFILSKEVILLHEGKYITIEFTDTPPEHEHKLMIGKKIVTPVGTILAKKINGWKKPTNPNTATFKYDDVKGRQLLLRYWKHGDKMKPFGMKGKSRLVSDILNEAGIKSERLKYFVPLIVFEDEPEFILWIPGIRSAEFGRLSNKSETAITLIRII